LLFFKFCLELDQDKVKDSFVEKLATQIIRNVQVNIKSIHIRYEDRITFHNNPFSFGCTLYDLTSFSTDSNWNRFIDKGQDPLAMIYKVEIEFNKLIIFLLKN
jgi:vacuolar protein sorting-associated protein 13A/C